MDSFAQVPPNEKKTAIVQGGCISLFACAALVHIMLLCDALCVCCALLWFVMVLLWRCDIFVLSYRFVSLAHSSQKAPPCSKVRLSYSAAPGAAGTQDRCQHGFRKHPHLGGKKKWPRPAWTPQDPAGNRRCWLNG